MGIFDLFGQPGEERQEMRHERTRRFTDEELIIGLLLLGSIDGFGGNGEAVDADANAGLSGMSADASTEPQGFPLDFVSGEELEYPYDGLDEWGEPEL